MKSHALLLAVVLAAAAPAVARQDAGTLAALTSALGAQQRARSSAIVAKLRAHVDERRNRRSPRSGPGRRDT